MKKLFLRTIGSQIIFILSGFVLLLMSLAAYTFYQNYKIKELNRIVAFCYQYQVDTFVQMGVIASTQNSINESISSLDTTGRTKWLANIDELVNNSLGELFEKKLDSIGIGKEKINIDELRGIWREIKKEGNITFDEILEAKMDSVNKNPSTKLYSSYRERAKKPVGEFYNFIFGKALIPKIMPRLTGAKAEAIGRAKNVVVLTVVLAGISLLFCGYAGYLFRRSLSKSIRKPKEMLEKLSKGELPETEPLTHNELSPVINASNMLTIGLKKASEFATEIGNGNFEKDYQPLSEKDMLGNALIGMRNNLKKFTLKEREQNWVNIGYTQISDILRSEKGTKEEISTAVLTNLIKYLNANQGAIFIYDENKNHLEMLSAYAYGRKKYMQKTLLPGEGLAGQVLLEAKTTYLKEIPDNYIQIRSGLGGANPRNILIVPLKTENGVEGVLEIASFKIFEPFMIELIEKIALNIAVAYTNTKIAERTQKLLAETTQMAETMKIHDEEMRQNMEELHSTQEESQRREKEYIKEIEKLKAEIERLNSGRYNLAS